MDSAGGVVDPSYAGIWDPSVSLLDASWHARVAAFWNANYAFTDHYRHMFDASAVSAATEVGILFGLLGGSAGGLLGTIAGSLQSWVLNGQSVRVCAVDYLCVDPTIRRQGVAARLIEHIVWYFATQLDSNVFVFQKEVVPAKIIPFSLQTHWLTFVPQDAGNPAGVSEWTPEDFHRAYEAYQEGQAYGRRFDGLDAFKQWARGSGRITLREEGGRHLSIVEDYRAVDVATGEALCEVVWTNGHICRNSVAYLQTLRKAGFGGVFWSSGLAARPWLELGARVPDVFSAWSMWYLFNWKHAPLQATWEGKRVQS